MKKTKLIVFDIDGTLTDTVKIYTRIFIESLKDMGVIEINANFGEYLHHTDSYIGKMIFEKDRKLNFTKEKLKEFEKYLYARCQKYSVHEIKGARKLVNYLETQTEYALCYATGSLLKPAEYKLEAISISYEPSLLVASNNIHERENIVQLAIDKAKAHFKINTFDRIVSIGDGVWDLTTAKNLGVDFIGVGTLSKKELLEYGCQYHFDDFTQGELPL